jgi:hypothetical protein
MDPTFPTMDVADYFALPTISDYVANHINHAASDVAPGDTRNKTCAICHEGFDQRDVESRGNASRIVFMSSCKHLFHRACIISQFDSDNDDRNRCATCHINLCRLNLLSPQKSAKKRRDAVISIDYLFSERQYASLITWVDQRYAAQPTDDTADYKHIPRAARDQWQEWGGKRFVCLSHVDIGPFWLEMAAMQRVMDHMLDDGRAESLPGRVSLRGDKP